MVRIKSINFPIALFTSRRVDESTSRQESSRRVDDQKWASDILKNYIQNQLYCIVPSTRSLAHFWLSTRRLDSVDSSTRRFVDSIIWNRRLDYLDSSTRLLRFVDSVLDIIFKVSFAHFWSLTRFPLTREQRNMEIESMSRSNLVGESM